MITSCLLLFVRSVHSSSIRICRQKVRLLAHPEQCHQLRFQPLGPGYADAQYAGQKAGEEKVSHSMFLLCQLKILATG